MVAKYTVRFNTQGNEGGTYQERDLLPSGLYLLNILEAKDVEVKTPCVKLVLKVIQGPIKYMDRKLYQTISFHHSLFKEILVAFGYEVSDEATFDTNDFVDRNLCAKVDVQKYQGKLKNTIIKFMSETSYYSSTAIAKNEPGDSAKPNEIDDADKVPF